MRTVSSLKFFKQPWHVIRAALLVVCGMAHFAVAQSPVVIPPKLGTPGLSCVISAVNRNAPIEIDGGATIFGIPPTTGSFRARATCSDGSIGQTAVRFSSVVGGQTIELGDIIWGRIDPVPAALGLSSLTKRLTTDQTGQLKVIAIGVDGSSRDVTASLEGTTYASSNLLLASITNNGAVTVLPLFAPGSSSRVVATAAAEGGVTGTYMFILGPRGTLRGKGRLG